MCVLTGLFLELGIAFNCLISAVFLFAAAMLCQYQGKRQCLLLAKIGACQRDLCLFHYNTHKPKCSKCCQTEGEQLVYRSMKVKKRLFSNFIRRDETDETDAPAKQVKASTKEKSEEKKAKEKPEEKKEKEKTTMPRDIKVRPW